MTASEPSAQRMPCWKLFCAVACQPLLVLPLLEDLRLAGLGARKWSSIASLWGGVFSYIPFGSATELRPRLSAADFADGDLFRLC